MTVPNAKDLAKDAKLGAKLKSARLAAGLDPFEAAAKLRCSKPHVIGLENGHHRPSIKLLARMAKVYKVRVFELMEGIS